MNRRISRGAALFSVALLSVVFATTAGARYDADSKAKAGKGVSDAYIVQLDDPPVAAYEGGIAGLEATSPAPGQKIDRNSPAVQRYVAYLESKQAEVANAVGATRFYSYAYAYNGFAAVLSKAQIAKLQKLGNVVNVERDQLAKLTTDNTPTFLGLTASGGLWSQLGGQSNAGAGIVVGVLDTGIWPEHPSFSPAGFGPPPATWHGSCQSGEQFSQNDCNNKLVGARYYLSGFGHFGIIKGDYKSARDADGHGSHTTSTAAGNQNVQASILGSTLGTISGMAPAARVAMYKVCWNGEQGGCSNADSVAAINDGIADGVDVFNFSISGTSTNYLAPVEVAFLMARRAGVFVATSAGNSGPGASTVNHISPWLMSVGASTQNRSFVGTTTLGSNQTFKGVTLTGGIASRPLVDSVAAGSELCFVGALNPSVVSGKIVLCRRGVTARVDKSLAVKQAGGVGMILYNVNDAQSLNTDNHWVPSLHVNFTAGSAIKAYIASAGAGATASLSGGQKEFGGGNTMADFSSRGPTIAGSQDVVKPDITAPGVNILAANTPTAFLGATGQLFQAIGGTSMSGPHIAGIGALLADLHPDWTPAEIQSAIMTSARQDIALEDGSTPAGPFAFGAGHVAPNGAANPGLVYPAPFDEYRAFLRSQGLCTFCFGTAPAPVKDPSDVNLPSIQIGSLAGVQTVTRTVKNVGTAATYTVDVDAPAGIEVSVNPTELTLAAGQTASYQVTFTTGRRATFNAYATGAISWSTGGKKGGTQARIPVAVRPVKLSAPTSITGTGTFGSATRSIVFGYQGQFTASPQGLIPATTETRTVVDDPTNDFHVDAPDTSQGIQVHTFSIPAGTVHARFSLFDAFTDGNDDIDIYLYNSAGQLVGFSAGGTSAEEINLRNPAAGTYKLYAHGWQTDGPDAVYTLFSWLLGNTAAGNMTVTASTSSATVGGTGTVTVAWSGLTTGTKYLGRVSYGDGSSEIGSTIVRIDS